MTEKGLSTGLPMNKFPLQFFGILPLNGIQTPWKKISSNFLLVFTFFCITSLNGPLLHFMVTANLNVEGILDALNVVAGALVGEFRMIFIALNRKKIQRLVSICENMWLDAYSIEDSKIILPWANRAKFLSKYLCLTWIFAVTLYVILPVIKQITPGADIRTRSWPYQINMDVMKSPRYEIFYVVQSIYVYVSTCSLMGCDFVGPFLTLHACGQFKLIQNWLKNLREEKSMLEERLYTDKNVEKTLKKCLRHHQILLRFCAELEEVVRYTNLSHALGGMYMMAISATRLTKMRGTGMLKQFGPLFLAIGQLLVSCWPAEYLLHESTMVAEALYTVPWYRCSPSIRKAVALMMLRSQRPAHLTVGKFTVYCLATFSSILSTSASIFMLLRSLDSVSSKPLDHWSHAGHAPATNTSEEILHQNRHYRTCNTAKAAEGIISTAAKVRTKVLGGVVRMDCRSQLKPTFLRSNSYLANFIETIADFCLSHFDRKSPSSMSTTQGSFWDHFWLAKLFFQAAGIIPIGGKSALWKSILSKFLASSPLFYSFYILIPEINYILFQIHDVDKLLEAILIVVSTLSGQIRSIFVILYRNKIARLFKICVKLWEQTETEDYKIIMIWSNRARLITTAYFCAAQCPVTLFIVTSTVKQVSSSENSTLKYYPFWPEEDSTPSPLYQIKYVLLVASGYFGISFVAACDMTGTLLALNICGQLAVIRNWLQEMSKNKANRNTDRESFNVQLKKCAHHHQVVMDFCTELEEAVKYNYLIQIVTEMYGMAVSGAGLQTSLGSYRFVGSLFLAICGLFFSCWPAENLSISSNEIAEAVYQIPWHLFSPREKTAVAIMLMRSQRVAQLSAGNFIPLSLETFSSIVSSGISFCLVLRSF